MFWLWVWFIGKNIFLYLHYLATIQSTVLSSIIEHAHVSLNWLKIGYVMSYHRFPFTLGSSVYNPYAGNSIRLFYLFKYFIKYNFQNITNLTTFASSPTATNKLVICGLIITSMQSSKYLSIVYWKLIRFMFILLRLCYFNVLGLK